MIWVGATSTTKQTDYQVLLTQKISKNEIYFF